MSQFPFDHFSPEKLNLESNLDSSEPSYDPLAITPKPTPTETLESLNNKKRILETTPPEIENKIHKSELLVAQPARNLRFDSNSDPASIMGENEDTLSLRELIKGLSANIGTLNDKVSTLSEKSDKSHDALNEIKNEMVFASADRATIRNMVVDLQKEVELLKATPIPANILGMKDDIKNDLKTELKPELSEEIKTDLKAEFKDELGSLYERQFLNNLLDDIYRHESGMVIFGFNWPNGVSTDQFRNFCRDQLKYGSSAASLNIRSVSTLSRGRGPNPRFSVLVMFGSIAERNEAIHQSFNLAGTKVSLDPYMPKCFEAKYREFKDSAWKLRTTMEVKTFIGFENHELVLKQRPKNTDGGKLGWAIFDNWAPKATDPPPPNMKNPGPRNDSNTSATIDKDAMKKMVFVSGLKAEIQEKELLEKFSDLVGLEDSALIERVVLAKKGTVVIHFLDAKSIAAFIQKHSGKELLGDKIRLSQG